MLGILTPKIWPSCTPLFLWTDPAQGQDAPVAWGGNGFLFLKPAPLTMGDQADGLGFSGTGGEGDPGVGAIYPRPPPQSPPKIRRQQMDLISELKRKQQKEPLIYESDRDGAIEDIITGEDLVGPVPSLVCPMLSSIRRPTLGVWLPHCLFATFLFFLFPFSPLLPSNPQCSRRCPSLPAPARGRPGSSVRPAWERRSPSSPQVPSGLASDPSGCPQPWGPLGGLSHAALPWTMHGWAVLEGGLINKQAPSHVHTTCVPRGVRPVPWSGVPTLDRLLKR